MNERAEAAQARLAELANKFLDRTAADIATMRRDLARVAQAEPGALGDIRHLAHRMVGTGATLGFESLSNSARRIEVLAESCPPEATPDDDLRTQLADALAALDAELQRLRS